uniref:Uncharacterized protein n=1 Tax=Arundo donax TaxID=35708 RepID=A0A0A9C0R7_ARUDO
MYRMSRDSRESVVQTPTESCFSFSSPLFSL